MINRVDNSSKNKREQGERAMKKTLTVLGFIVGALFFGASQSYAVPVIDGLLGAGEWDNIGYTYYLNVFDPNESDVTPDTMDIFRVTLLQELDPAFGGTGTTASLADDGVYLMIQAYVTPTTLEDPDGLVSQKPVLALEGDFFGDGTADPFNIFIRQRNTTPFNGINDPAADSLTWCFGDVFTCDPDGGGYLPFDGLVGGLGGVSSHARADVYEYFLPTGAFGTPVAPFPTSFKGTVLFDNGNAGLNTSDDIVMGSVAIPEPATMFLFGGGLFGLLGLRRFRSKKS